MLRDVELMQAPSRTDAAWELSGEAAGGSDTWAGAYLTAATPRDPHRSPPALTGDPSPDRDPLTTRSAHGAPERPARGPFIGLTAEELPRHWPLSRSLGAAATRAPHGEAKPVQTGGASLPRDPRLGPFSRQLARFYGSEPCSSIP